jgi:L-ascorbate 6-phosphate lactonase
MQCLRDYPVPSNALALWFLGQNGFVLKTHEGTLIAIDPYLTNSCAERNPGHSLDLNRVLPLPLKPEHLKVDHIVFTHSHDDHLDLDTIRAIPNRPTLIAPWEAIEKLRALSLPDEQLVLIHPNQTLTAGDLSLKGVFAFPTDATDLNHIGVLITLPDGMRFYNTGDTAYASLLADLLPANVDICAICINGGFHNLSHGEAARIVKTINPDSVIPTHYDLMACNQSDPEMFRIALLNEQIAAQYCLMDNNHIYLYKKEER